MPRKEPNTKAATQLGQFIVENRKKKGITSYRLAKLTGLAESTILNLEKGMDTRLSTFYLIVNALDLSNIDVITFIAKAREIK